MSLRLKTLGLRNYLSDYFLGWGALYKCRYVFVIVNAVIYLRQFVFVDWKSIFFHSGGTIVGNTSATSDLFHFGCNVLNDFIHWCLGFALVCWLEAGGIRYIFSVVVEFQAHQVDCPKSSYKHSI